MLPILHAMEMCALMTDSTLIHFDGVGHLIHATATELTVRHVLNFLESLP
jgi:pimeloyl-ACP methyl ester carboxylesterase